MTYLTLSYNTVGMEPERRYTLSELADACAAALDALGVAVRNGQVRDRPDARTIRYYTSLGLVGRPAEMTGRTGWYGDRHLLQVLAVKAMQARGASLADVQRILVGASTDELRSAIGPGLPAALAAAARPAAEPDRAFWRTRPGAAGAPSAPPATTPLAPASSAAGPSGAGPSRGGSARAVARAGPADVGPARAGPPRVRPATVRAARVRCPARVRPAVRACRPARARRCGGPAPARVPAPARRRAARRGRDPADRGR